jgi:inosine-uridine nucleoside N-ribohydrolase
MLKLHLDTDIGGDIDDLCALAMLLRWPDLEITGVTTAAEDAGRRAGYADYVLRLAGQTDVPLAAGADVSRGGYRWEPLEYPPDDIFWPEPIPRRPGSLADALELLKHSVEAGAVVVATGPYTNLRLLDEAYPGILRKANLVLMGGYITPARAGFPQWGNDMDFNIQADIGSARHVLEHARPLLVPLTMTVETTLRCADIPRLRQADAVAQLVARQAEAFTDNADYGRLYSGLPDDFINFQHDPLACAVALGWDGVTIEETPVAITIQDGWLVERVDPAGRPMRVVTSVDADRFNRFWADVVTQHA